MTKSRRPEGSSWNTSRDVSLFFIVYAAALTESVEITSDVSATYEFSPDSCWGNKTHHFWHEVSDYRSFWPTLESFCCWTLAVHFMFSLTLSLASYYIYLFLWGYKIKLLFFFSPRPSRRKQDARVYFLSFEHCVWIHLKRPKERHFRTQGHELFSSVWACVGLFH